jgi:hypothetical protein
MGIYIYDSGASTAEIERGIAAAHAVFMRCGLTPEHCARQIVARDKGDAWGQRGVAAWAEAEAAALDACCLGWGRIPPAARLKFVACNEHPSDDFDFRSARDIVDREHAPYSIARTFEALGLHACTHAILCWLGQYDGLEIFIPVPADPALEVCKIISGYLTNTKLASVSQMAADFSQLEVLHYRATWVNERTGDRRPWMPPQEAWLDFVSRGGPDEQLRVCFSETKQPTAEQVRDHLLTLLQH